VALFEPLQPPSRAPAPANRATAPCTCGDAAQAVSILHARHLSPRAMGLAIWLPSFKCARLRAVIAGAGVRPRVHDARVEAPGLPRSASSDKAAATIRGVHQRVGVAQCEAQAMQAFLASVEQRQPFFSVQRDRSNAWRAHGFRASQRFTAVRRAAVPQITTWREMRPSAPNLPMRQRTLRWNNRMTPALSIAQKRFHD